MTAAPRGYRSLLLVAAGLLLIGAVVVGLRSAGILRLPIAEPTTGRPTATVETAEQQQARIRRACEAAVKRIRSGAPMAMDIQGWVVELWLARERGAVDLLQDPALNQLIADGRLAPGAGDVLDRVDAGTATVHPDESRVRSSLSTAVIRLEEGYVRAFLTNHGRKDLERLAARVMADSKADFAALYGKCAHLGERDVGAFYAGRGANGAAAALLFAAGQFSKPPAVDPPKKLSQLTQAAREQQLTTAGLAGLLKSFGGRIYQPPKHRSIVAVSFPVGGPTRAFQASKKIAGQLKLRHLR